MARDVASDLLGSVKKGLPPMPPGAKVPAKAKTPAVPKPPAQAKAPAAPVKGKTAPVVAPAPGKKAAPVVSRGAIVKKDAKTPAAPRAPRTPAVKYEDSMKIALVEGARAYRAGGNVEKAVDLIKKSKTKTVKDYVEAMERSENPLPAIGLLRFLDKKGAVTVK